MKPARLNELPTDYREDVIRYIDEVFIAEPPVIAEYRAKAAELRIPPAAVQPILGKFLAIQAAMLGAKCILEIGTLWGYSAWWLHQAVAKNGAVISLEKELKHYRLTTEFLQAAGAASVEVRHADVMETITHFAETEFDMVFLDADKQEYPQLLEPITRILRPGGLLVADNVLYSKGWPGTPAHTNEAAQADARIAGAREFNWQLAHHSQYIALPVPFGFGVMLAYKKAE